MGYIALIRKLVLSACHYATVRRDNYSPLIIGPTGGMTLAGNILGPSIFQVRADTYLDLNINGTTLLGIGSSTLDVRARPANCRSRAGLGDQR